MFPLASQYVFFVQLQTTEQKRAILLKEFLIKNITSSNLCVTHGIFLKMFLCVILYGDDLDVETYVKMSLFNPADNAGITILEYYPLKFFSNPWEIVAYNDSPLMPGTMSI